MKRHRSYIGLPERFKATCYALGLYRRFHTSLILPTAVNVGRLLTIKNLCKITFVKNGPFPQDMMKLWLEHRDVPASRGFYVEKTSPFAPASAFIS